MAPVRGEGTKAILVRGEAEDRLVPFLFEGVAFRVPAKLLRHHPNHPDCPVIKEALLAPNSWKETVTKGRELTSGTVRCTGGCWSAYEAAEQRRIARGDQAALKDWQGHGRQARAQLAHRIQEGSVTGAYAESSPPDSP